MYIVNKVISVKLNYYPHASRLPRAIENIWKEVLGTEFV